MSRILETTTQKEFHKPPRAYPWALFRFLSNSSGSISSGSISRSYSRSTLGKVGGSQFDGMTSPPFRCRAPTQKQFCGSLFPLDLGNCSGEADARKNCSGTPDARASPRKLDPSRAFFSRFRQQQAATSMWATESVIRMHSVRHAFLASSNHWIRKTTHLVQCRAALILCAKEVSCFTSCTFSCRRSHNSDSMTHTNYLGITVHTTKLRTPHTSADVVHINGPTNPYTMERRVLLPCPSCAFVVAPDWSQERNCKWLGNIQDVARARGLACIVTVQSRPQCRHPRGVFFGEHRFP